jgi:hypothetical protein
MVLRDEFKLKEANLAKEVDAFIKLPNTPQGIIDFIDAIRQVGNLAAHPEKYMNTDEIVDVEPEEAEWLLDLLEDLFDFTFVQPRKKEARKNKLNAKLKTLGKIPMKN